ncbi:MAG: adenosylcobyric acid synthase, partial [Actinomycetota bacterium]|nr:adenosylcobyric acid synthase [Actinomycetota bacterium]
VHLPFASNLTDVEPLAAEPGMVVTVASVPQQLDGADLVILPGTRATVEDMRWLVGRGFDHVLRARAGAGLPVLGICGGYQMLGERIDDDIESEAGSVAGLGLLPVTTTFYADKTLASRRADLHDGTVVTGYEIRHGVVTRQGAEALFADEGARHGSVAGTSWHGLFESDGYRRQFLASVAAANGRRFVVSEMDWAGRRDRQLDRLADLMELHLDCDALAQLAGTR